MNQKACSRSTRIATIVGISLVLIALIAVIASLALRNNHHIVDECNKDNFTSFAPENLTWNIFSYLMDPKSEVAIKENILDEKFVGVTLGESFKDSHLSLNPCIKNLYRFSIFPQIEGERSRVELSTCFVQKNQLPMLFGSPSLDPAVELQLHCPVVNLSPQLIHTHEYELYIPRTHVSIDGKFILAQWHGTADWNLLKDEQGCIAEISSSDRHSLCSNSSWSCSFGKVFNKQKKVNLLFEQGGYPPLTFELRNGYFQVIARSDDRIFISKGGCSTPKQGNSKICRDHPRKQIQIIYQLPFNDFMFDTWLKFEWKIKWSEYSSGPWKKNEDSGVLLSNAWIRLLINNELVLDWRGPCGRNDDGRIPYFKSGVYNPSGSLSSIQFYLKNYNHFYNSSLAMTTQMERKKIESLRVRAKPTKVFSNFNSLTEDFKFTNMSGDCTLRY